MLWALSLVITKSGCVIIPTQEDVPCLGCALMNWEMLKRAEMCGFMLQLFTLVVAGSSGV